MKMAEAMKIIRTPKESGYRVHFERKEGTMLLTDYFPDRSEDLIKDIDVAWSLAKEFADAMKGKVVNLYVVDADFSPVADYEERMIVNRDKQRG